MKKLLALVLVILMMVSLVACGSENAPSGDVTPPGETDVNTDGHFTATGKTLVVYFSRTGTTQSIAEQIATLTGADLFRVERKEPYPSDYTPTTEVAREEKAANARPELATYLPKATVTAYDTILLGFPIWWGTAPMPILSFLNFYDLSGKNIHTFCTSGSSPISGSTADIRTNAPGANVTEGKRFSAGDTDAIRAFVESLDL